MKKNTRLALGAAIVCGSVFVITLVCIIINFAFGVYQSVTYDTTEEDQYLEWLSDQPEIWDSPESRYFNNVEFIYDTGNEDEQRFSYALSYEIYNDTLEFLEQGYELYVYFDGTDMWIRVHTDKDLQTAFSQEEAKQLCDKWRDRIDYYNVSYYADTGNDLYKAHFELIDGRGQQVIKVYDYDNWSYEYRTPDNY
jgi:hypothetical protein